jgi:hypothetical protein
MMMSRKIDGTKQKRKQFSCYYLSEIPGNVNRHTLHEEGRNGVQVFTPGQW